MRPRTIGGRDADPSHGLRPFLSEIHGGSFYHAGKKDRDCSRERGGRPGRTDRARGPSIFRRGLLPLAFVVLKDGWKGALECLF